MLVSFLRVFTSLFYILNMPQNVQEIRHLEHFQSENGKIFRGSAPNPAGGAYSAPQTPQLFYSRAALARSSLRSVWPYGPVSGPHRKQKLNLL